MPRTARPELQEETRQAIKATARTLMREQGTAGLSIRAIARAMNITAPALYHYYASLDALLTDLIVDAFNASADALEAALHADAQASPADRLAALLHAYRGWALRHPVEFQLIYGNPIAGYSAPSEITVPAASRTQVLFAQALDPLLRSGGALNPALTHVPPTVADHLGAVLDAGGFPSEALHPAYLAMLIWAQAHGLVTLELHDHLPPSLGDVSAAYDQFIAATLAQLGASP